MASDESYHDYGVFIHLALINWNELRQILLRSLKIWNWKSKWSNFREICMSFEKQCRPAWKCSHNCVAQFNKVRKLNLEKYIMKVYMLLMRNRSKMMLMSVSYHIMSTILSIEYGEICFLNRFCIPRAIGNRHTKRDK